MYTTHIKLNWEATMQKSLIVTLLFSIVIAIFAILNAAPIEINLIATRLSVSAALVILISASFGAVVVYSLEVFSKLKAKKQYRDLEKQYKELEKKLDLMGQENAQMKERLALSAMLSTQAPTTTEQDV